MEETNLIEGCRNADPKAQRAMLDQYSGLLYNVSLRYALDRSEAKDILQEAWVRIFNGISKYRHEGRLEGWMTRIVINVALRNKEGLQRKSSIYVDSFFEDPIEESNAIDRLQYDDLIRIVNQLPKISREVFKMAAIDGLKHKEIGELLNIEESTSRAHLSKAKKKLQELITRLEKVEYYGE